MLILDWKHMVPHRQFQKAVEISISFYWLISTLDTHSALHNRSSLLHVYLILPTACQGLFSFSWDLSSLRRWIFYLSDLRRYLCRFDGKCQNRSFPSLPFPREFHQEYLTNPSSSINSNPQISSQIQFPRDTPFYTTFLFTREPSPIPKRIHIDT